MKKTEKELRELLTNAGAQMEAISDLAKAEKRELTPEESMKYNQHKRDVEMAKNSLSAMAATNALDAQHTKREHSFGARLREFILNGKPGEEFGAFNQREAATGNTMSDSQTNGVDIKPILEQVPADNDVYQTAGCPIQTAAAGITSWPFAGAVTASIVGELDTPSTTKIDFTKVSALQQRMSVKVLISNQALYNSDQDLEAYAMRMISQAINEFVNFAATSTTKAGTNFYGGFAHANKQSGTYTSFDISTAMEMVGKVAAKNYDPKYGVFVMGADDYFALKATPRDAGSGLMVIGDDNTICGFPVIYSNAINRATVRGTASGHNIGFGLFNFLPCLQHGQARLTKDNSSVNAADVDGTYLVINADWSMTDLFPDAFVVYGKSN